MGFTAKIDADVTGFEQGVAKAQKSIGNLQTTVEQKLSAVGTKFQEVGAKASILSAALITAGASAFKMAADFQDAAGATDQIFKSSSEAVSEWANSLESYYGIAKKEALEYANIMGSMLQNIGGMSEEMAGKTAGSLVELAGDLTAMFGGRTEDAVRALTGALKGNNTMLDNYGMAVNDALVKAKALELGLSSGTGELSLQAKQAATLALIWDQTGSAQGQAAREADGASGSMRALGVEVKNLATQLGEILLPVITPLISGIGNVIAYIKNLSPAMQTTIVVVGGLVAAFGPVLLMIGKIITMLPVLKVAFAALTGPIGIVAVAVAAAVGLIIANWDNIVAYFTTGAGAAVFNTIKELADELWQMLKAIWTGLTNDIKLIWGQFGGYLTGSFGIALDTIMKIVKVALDVILGLFNVFKNLAQGNFKGAWESIKTMTSNIWQGIWQVLKNTLAGMTNAIAAFFDLIGADKIAAKMTAFARSIAPVLTPKKTEIIVDVKEETVGQIKSVTDDLNDLSETISGGKSPVKRIEIDKNLQSINGGLLTGVSTNGNNRLAGLTSMTEYAAKYKQAAEEIKYISIDLNTYITDTFADMAASIGDALMNGKNVLQAVGKSLLGSLGSIMVQLGKMVLASGLGIEAVKKALSTLNGPVAIAAGAALIAIGSIFAAGASKLGSSMGSGSVGRTSGAGIQTTVSPVTPAYRGSYFDGSEVTFKIGTNELVGVLAMANNRNNRL